MLSYPTRPYLQCLPMSVATQNQLLPSPEHQTVSSFTPDRQVIKHVSTPLGLCDLEHLSLATNIQSTFRALIRLIAPIRQYPQFLFTQYLPSLLALNIVLLKLIALQNRPNIFAVRSLVQQTFKLAFLYDQLLQLPFRICLEQQRLLDRPPRRQPIHNNRLGLPNPMRPVHCLQILLRV